MKIAFVGNLPSSLVFPEDYLRSSGGPVGHPAPWILALLPALRRMTDHSLRVVIVQRNILKPCFTTVDGVEYQGIPSFVPDKFNRRTFYYQKSIPVARVLREFKPDLVHGFGFETGNALIALRSGFPVSCFIQGIAEVAQAFYGQRGLIERKVSVLGERLAVPRVRWMVAENQFARDWALSRNPSAHVEVIPHPTREVFFEEARPTYEKRILTVGGLDDRKGMDVVIRAFARLSDAESELVVVGGGPLRAALESLAGELGVGDRVSFTGPLATEGVIREMNRARVLVLASRTDTSPNVVSEAHAIGLPVVGSRVGGIPEMIEEGKDGFLFEREDHTDAASKLAMLLADRSLAERLGKSGREKVRRLNSAQRVAEAHAAFFKRVAEDLVGR